MADTAVLLLLLQQIVQNDILGVKVGADIHLTHIVKAIEVGVIHPALLQLLFRDLLHLAHVTKVIVGKLVAQVEFVPGISGQDLTDGQLQCSGLSPPRGVIVVHTPLHGQDGYFLHGSLIYHSIIPTTTGRRMQPIPRLESFKP